MLRAAFEMLSRGMGKYNQREMLRAAQKDTRPWNVNAYLCMCVQARAYDPQGAREGFRHHRASKAASASNRDHSRQPSREPSSGILCVCVCVCVCVCHFVSYGCVRWSANVSSGVCMPT